MKALACLITFSLMLIAFAASAQTAPQLIPPSPTAYSLGKYGDLPIGNYTGVPDISIPIYTLRDGKITVDISLSYHGAGIKVDEQASFVGLGWSLNAGGVITRTVKGRADGLNSSGNLVPAKTSIPFYNYPGSGNLADYITNHNLYGAANGTTDNGPDEFFFNFMGKSGKFTFDNTGKAILDKDAPLDIKWYYVNDDAQKFVVRDDAGTIYEFSDYETAYFGSTDGLKITAWYLSKITTPDNRVVTFKYYNAAGSDNYSRTTASTVFEISPAYADITHPINATYVSTFGMSELRLHKIVSGSSTVELKYQTQKRKDYWAYWNSGASNLAWSALDSIIVYKPDGSLFKKTKLYTSYFEADNDRKYSGVNPEIFQFLNYRLRLDSVQELNATGVATQPPFICSYLGDNNPAVPDVYTLPYRLSPSQDHWGYYNASFNTHLFPGNPDGRAVTPEAWIDILQNQDHDPIYRSFTNGANRETDTAAAKACVLRQISYPTGGVVVYDFESNKVANFGGLRIKKISHIPTIGQAVSTVFTYEGIGAYDPRNYYYKSFTINYQFASPLDPETGMIPEYIPVGYLSVFGIPHTGESHPTNPAKFVKITASPQAILGLSSRAGYISVTVSQAGNGKTIYHYVSAITYPDLTEYLGLETAEVPLLNNMFKSDYVRTYWALRPSVEYNSAYITANDWPYPEIYSNEWKRGMLSGKTVIAENGDTIRSEYHNYRGELLSANPGYVAGQLGTGEFVYAKYYTPHARLLLDSSVVIEYGNMASGKLITATRYHYDNLAHLQPTKTVTYKSNGVKHVSITSFPSDYAAGSASIDNMVSRHLLSYPLENVNYVESELGQRVVGGRVVKYRADGSGIKDQELILENQGPISIGSFKLSNRPLGVLPPNGTNTAFQEDPRYKPAITFNKFDETGNPLQVTGRDGIVTSYLWGYNRQYPVAKVLGVEYNSIKSFVDTSLLNNPTTNATMIKDELNKIHTGLSGSKFQVDTYTYDPLVGMTSAKDSRGQTVFYEYDDFNRLKLVRNQEQNIVNQLSYQYSVPTHNNPVWISVSKRCVKDGSGENTGEEEEEIRDTNPESPTYNQTQWVSLGNTGSCPAPIYAVVYYDDCWSDGMDEYCELVFNFYSDAGLTTPVSVNGLQINVRLDEYINGTQYTSYSSYSCYGTESRHGGWRVTGDGYSAIHYLEPGQGYKY